MKVEVAGLLVVDMELKRTRSEERNRPLTFAPPPTSQPSECNRSGECPSPRHSPNPIAPRDYCRRSVRTSGRAMLGSFVGSSESKGMLSPMMPWMTPLCSISASRNSSLSRNASVWFCSAMLQFVKRNHMYTFLYSAISAAVGMARVGLRAEHPLGIYLEPPPSTVLPNKQLNTWFQGL